MILYEPSAGLSEMLRARLNEPMPAETRHLAPILQGVADGVISYAIVMQNEQRWTVPEGRPVVLVIGDDLAEAKGPRAFSMRSLRIFLPRCSAVAFMGNDPHAFVYAEAARMAREGHTVAIIESQPEQAEAWIALVDKMAPQAKLLICLPHPGEVR